MDRTGILNRVRAHLCEQQQPATIDWLGETRCVYRTKTGLKCAIGILIPDEDFDPVLNGMPLDDIDVVAMLSQCGLGFDPEGDDMDFLLALQAAHDDAKPGPHWLDEVLLALSRVRYRFIEPDRSIGEVDLCWQRLLDERQNLTCLHVESPSNGDEFDQIEPSLQLLDLVHE